MYPWEGEGITLEGVLDYRQLGYMYDDDPPLIELQAPSIIFNNIPEGETTVRAACFSVSSCNPVHFEIISGPTLISGPPETNFGTPIGSSVALESAEDLLAGKAYLWISYTGTSDGDAATGEVTIRCTRYIR